MLRLARPYNGWLLVVGVLITSLYAAARQAPGRGEPQDELLTKPRAIALDQISADSLKGHLSFLASDLLEGRDTPSRGLDIAAEYIAAQFRRAGLEPAGNDGYFQTANWKVVEPNPASFHGEINLPGAAYHLDVTQVSLVDRGAIDLENVPLVRLSQTGDEALKALSEEQVEGKAVVCDLPLPGDTDQEPRRSRLSVSRAQANVVGRLRELKAVAVVWLDSTTPLGSGLPKGRLIDPEARGLVAARATSTAARPISLSLHDRALIGEFDKNPSPQDATLTLKVDAPVERPATLRNVAGLLRGSDDALKDTYVIVSAHYDHIGIGGQAGQTDRIYNGANDDGSGTVMVIELAHALAKLEPRPKRSILFLTFFGEEHGLLGSRYYGRHPLVPLEQTIAMLNLEQVGRTDDTEGEQKRRASITGFDFSDVGSILERAGKAVDIEIYKHPRNSDSFFGRSDNQALADRGVPAHTLCTSYIYPDYHGAGDHWDKIDYANMACVARGVALGLMMLGDEPKAPRWNESIAAAARYAKAWKALHGDDAGGSP